MDTQATKARAFAALHVARQPLVLCNIWDAGSAKAVADAGAAAIATGSWSVAAAQGYADGEQIPLELLLTIASRIAATVDLPLSIDIESGYAEDRAGLQQTIQGIIEAGAVGINFEDQVVGSGAIRDMNEQAERIAAVRETADSMKMPLFINARTDVFLRSDPAAHRGLLQSALERAAAYREAGASGLFVPGLLDETLIAELCETSPLPVNVMMTDAAPSIAALSELGVSRISRGPMPYVKTMQALGALASIS